MTVAVTAIWSAATKLSNMPSPAPEIILFRPQRGESPLSVPPMTTIVYVFACHQNIMARMSDNHEVDRSPSRAEWLN